MPRRKYGRKRGRKTYRRKKRQIVNYMGPSISPMPKRFITKLKYCQSVPLDGGVAGIVAKHVFRANDLYDPDYTGTGHQPRGFDELMLFYNHFVVLGSRITARVSNQDSNGAYCVGIANSAEPATDNQLNEYIERQDVKFQVLGVESGKGTTTLTKNFSSKRFLGRSNVLSDPQLKGSASGSPTELGYFNLFAGAVDEATDQYECNAIVTIEYIAMFIEPKKLGQS